MSGAHSHPEFDHSHPEVGTNTTRLDDLEARVAALESKSHEHVEEPAPAPEPAQSASWDSPFTGFHKRPIQSSWRRVAAPELAAYGDGTEVYAGFPDANKIGMKGSNAEEVFFLDASDDPISVDVYAPKQWNDRCGGTNFEGTLQMPRNWRTGMSSAVPGSTPNNQTVVLQPDGETVYVIKSADPCEQYVAAGWLTGPYNIADPIEDVSGRGAARFGNGCEIRAADMTAPEIEHAVIILPSAHMLYGATPANGGQNDTGHPGFVWPASDQDGNYNADHEPSTYKGGTPELTMGSILTTGPSFDHADWAHLSPFFQKWLRAVEKYGAVIGDISAWSKQFTYIAVEAAIADDFRAQWSDPEQAALTQVMRQLEVVVPPEAETT